MQNGEGRDLKIDIISATMILACSPPESWLRIRGFFPAA